MKDIPTDEMGAAGVRRAAAVLGTALCAETNNSTMSEEGAKIDLRISIRNAFNSKAAVSIHCQVKHGQSFRAPKSDREKIFLQIDQSTIDSLSEGSTPGLIIWVPPRPLDRLYWHIIKSQPKAKLKPPVEIPRYQYVTPSLRFHLTRMHAHMKRSINTPRLDVAIGNEPSIVSKAKAAYKKLAQESRNHPLTGNLKVTRTGWRHVTRRSKAKNLRLQSLRLVPYLGRFLQHPPDRFALHKPTFRTEGKRTIESYEVVCWYINAFNIAGVTHNLMVRIREEVSYPTHWQGRPLYVDEVLQKATLVSWWAKPKKS